jgi:hypothetical protein
MSDVLNQEALKTLSRRLAALESRCDDLETEIAKLGPRHEYPEIVEALDHVKNRVVALRGSFAALRGAQT